MHHTTDICLMYKSIDAVYPIYIESINIQL
jgi:hypothetical protein